MDSDELKIFATIYTSIGMCGVFFIKLLFIERAYKRVRRGKDKTMAAWDLFISGSTLLFIIAGFSVYWGPRFAELKFSGNTVVNGLYFTITTISTIGFGDL